MTAAYEANKAHIHALYNTVPNTIVSISSGLTSTTTAAASALLPYAGKWVWLKARVGTITVLRGSSTVVSGVGIVLPPGVAVPFYVSTDTTNGDFRLSHISDTAASYLDILSDSEAG